MGGTLKEVLGVNDLSKGGILWRAIFAEFLGNIILNFFGCASIINLADGHSSFVLISLTFGLAVFLIVQTFGHVSGAHVNPAVTVGMLVTGRISVIMAALYIIAQCIGAIVGSSFLKILTPEDQQGLLGLTALNNKLSPFQGMMMEFFLGFILVIVVFGVCDENKGEANKAVGALAIGLSVTLGHLAAVDYTGSSMNPARSFGSAIAVNKWDHHWIYWIGPCLGGAVAALLYSFAFAAPKPYVAVSTEEKEMTRLDSDPTKNDNGHP